MDHQFYFEAPQEGERGYDIRHGIFHGEPDDGIDLLPDRSGVYAIFNVFTGRRYVGVASTSLRKRAQQHRSELRRGNPSNLLMKGDFMRYGAVSFVFLMLEEIHGDGGTRARRLLGRHEINWVIRLRASDERYGYNNEAGHIRTPSALLRDVERRKLKLPNSYSLLPGVSLSDPIHPSLAASWMQGR